jgi:hypothetical protein
MIGVLIKLIKEALLNTKIVPQTNIFNMKTCLHLHLVLPVLRRNTFLKFEKFLCLILRMSNNSTWDYEFEVT